jgi:hypothetical protein
MIATSIGELRTLGAYWHDDQQFTPASCRTLILGFRYTLDVDSTTVRGNPKREYEIVFLHRLPESTVSKPKLAVFATSDARTQFHLLEETDPESVEQLATVSADIRFADTRLAGMYPQAPVVTRVYHSAILSVPVELVKSQIAGLGGTLPEDGFSGILDQLYVSATGTDAPATSESVPTTATEVTPPPATDPTPTPTAKDSSAKDPTPDPTVPDSP